MTWNHVMLGFIKDIVHVLFACMQFSCDFLKRGTYVLMLGDLIILQMVSSERKMSYKLAAEWIYIVSLYPLLAFHRMLLFCIPYPNVCHRFINIYNTLGKCPLRKVRDYPPSLQSYKGQAKENLCEDSNLVSPKFLTVLLPID